MQFKFLIAFVLMGACLIQATSAQPSIISGIEGDITGVGRGLVDDAMENARKLIESIQKAIQSKIDEAIETLNNLKLKITQLVNDSIAKMKQDLQNIITRAQNAIEEIKAKAAKLGIDISDCINDNQDKFQKLFEKFLANEVNCVTGEVETALKIITETIQMLTKVADQIKNLPNELQNCATGSNKIKCITDLIKEAINLKLEVMNEITKKIQEVTEFVAGLQGRIQACPAEQLAAAGVEATKIVSDIAKCALDKGVK